MADSIILNKVTSIERCLMRIEQDYQGHEGDFRINFMRQDSVTMNIQRACEQTIDLANHLIKINNWTVPSGSRKSFEILFDNEVISNELSLRLQGMVGFRNIAVHEYSKLDLDIVIGIINNNLVDFKKFCEQALRYL